MREVPESETANAAEPPPRARATMRDVAQAAGVGLKTVSRVVNDEPDVAPATRARVQEALDQLGYRHNAAASALRRSAGRQRLVGVVLQDLSNTYSAQLLRVIDQHARRHGMVVVATSLDEDPAAEERVVTDLVERRVDGLVLVPATDSQSYLAADVAAGLPVVVLDRRPRGLECDSIGVDNEDAAARAVAHLVRHGHERVAVLSDLPHIETAAERVAGYRHALADAGLPVDERLVRAEIRDAAQARAEVVRLLGGDAPPTAIFSARNAIAVGTVTALTDLGLQHTVAHVGFDDFPLSALLTPRLTVVRQRVSEQGALAADMLFARVTGSTAPPRRVVLDCELVARGSGEITPPQD